MAHSIMTKDIRKVIFRDQKLYLYYLKREIFLQDYFSIMGYTSYSNKSRSNMTEAKEVLV